MSNPVLEMTFDPNTIEHLGIQMYSSMPNALAELIDYDIACETVNKLLDDKEQLKKELESARWYQTIQNKDISKLRGLLKECLAHLSLGEIGTSVTPINTLIDRINAALNESEER